MVRHAGWKYLGDGIERTAYLVNGHVIKVPLSYFRFVLRSLPESNIQVLNQLRRTADFEVPPIGDPYRDLAINEALEAQRISRHYGNFGAKTRADNEGLIHQEYISGVIPSREQANDFEQTLIRTGYSVWDISPDNFRITPQGNKIFDMGETMRGSRYQVPRRRHR